MSMNANAADFDPSGGGRGRYYSGGGGGQQSQYPSSPGIVSGAPGPAMMMSPQQQQQQQHPQHGLMHMMHHPSPLPSSPQLSGGGGGGSLPAGSPGGTMMYGGGSPVGGGYVGSNGRGFVGAPTTGGGRQLPQPPLYDANNVPMQHQHPSHSSGVGGGYYDDPHVGRGRGQHYSEYDAQQGGAVTGGEYYPNEGVGGGGVYDPSTGGGGVAPPPPPPGGGGSPIYDYSAAHTEHQPNWNAPTPVPTPTDVLPGSYYPTSHFQPHLHGAPISSVAYDPYVDALYVSSHTQRIGTETGGPRGGGMMSSTVRKGQNNNNRASLLACHGGTDGSLYSLCAAHAEASTTTLDHVSQMLYGSSGAGGGSDRGKKTAVGLNRTPHVPSHAYKPPYGHAQHTSSRLAAPFGGGATVSMNDVPYKMGITKTLPFHYNGEGFVTTVSPAGVRVHSRGGLLLSDWQEGKGCLCGTFHVPYVSGGDVTHVSVGGGMVSSKPSRKPKLEVLHCLDLYQGLRVVSTQSVTVDESKAEGGAAGSLGVMDVVTNLERNTMVAGLSDGTVRLFDGSWRKKGGGGGGEVAKMKAHGGGVVKVAVSEDGNLICTTGYASRPSHTASPSTTPYAFPDQHILLFDVRYLGRGGYIHPFSGLRGGPRFVNFIPSDPNNCILVGSGQSGGGLQIITPFENMDGTGSDGGAASYLQPPLNSGEFMTDVCLSGRDVAIGTSQSNVLKFRRMAGFGGGNGVPRTAGGSVVGGEFVPAASSVDGGGGVGGSGGPSIELSDDVLEEKEPLVMPPYVPSPPELSIDPTVILKSDPRDGAAPLDVPRSVFNSYTMQAEPTVTSLGGGGNTTFGPLSDKVMITPSRRTLSSKLNSAATKRPSSSLSSRDDNDFLSTVPTSELDLNLLSTPTPKEGGGKGKRNGVVVCNPNKLLFSKSSAVCYNVDADPRKGSGRQRRGRPGGTGGVDDGFPDDDDHDGHHPTIPPRYRRTSRPPGYLGITSFDYARYNDTGLWPGWDYPPSMPNSYASSVLLLLYFIPEIRSAVLKAQYVSRLFGSGEQVGGGESSSKERKRMDNSALESGPALSPELGFLFHQIESHSAQAMTHPVASDDRDKCRAKVGAFVPSNFLTAFTALPEASALALLDGAPAAVEIARRPEAFYRFLVHHLDSELASGEEQTPPSSQQEDQDDVGNKLIDSLQGIDFTSVNEFVTGSGPPTVSSTRALTVDLAYDAFVSGRGGSNNERTTSSHNDHPTFADVLRHSLCKESRLRAWNELSRSYATVVQRKIATSLPTVLALACSCAGREGNDGRLRVWRKSIDDDDGGGAENRHWLPEVVEVELEENGNVVVREQRAENDDADGCAEEWVTSADGEAPLPSSVSSLLARGPADRRKVRYRLDAVVSFVRDSTDGGLQNTVPNNAQSEGHHVLHVRVPPTYETRALNRQHLEAEKCASLAKSFPVSEATPSSVDSEADDSSSRHLTLTSATPPEVYRQRANVLSSKLEKVREDQSSIGRAHDDSWVLVNGFVVSKTIAEDARAFHVPFKEPCLVVYRDVSSWDRKEEEGDAKTLDESDEGTSAISKFGTVPDCVMDTLSISTGLPPEHAVHRASDLPGEGDLVAFDAEFVSVQHEESVLTSTGSKEVITEGRHALARMSLIDCRTGTVIVDDHVLPREPVLDYLTRFSGIVQHDLDPTSSPHHLVSTRSAYLKLRLLLDRGCIFVGHGLSQDFLIVNIFVPPSQIIDTVKIFHQNKKRHISLRFLAYCLLHRDMQQDTHDSIEDAKAAYEVYLKALEFKKRGTFDRILNDIYEHGQRTDWKVGVEEVEA